MSNKGVQGSRIPSEVHGTVGHGPSAPTTPPIVDRRSFLLILFRRLGGGDGASSSSSFSSQSSMGASAGSTRLTRARLCCMVGAERGDGSEDAGGQRAAARSHGCAHAAAGDATMCRQPAGDCSRLVPLTIYRMSAPQWQSDAVYSDRASFFFRLYVTIR